MGTAQELAQQRETSLREKLSKYAKSQGKTYAQILRECIKQLPEVEAKKQAEGSSIREKD